MIAKYKKLLKEYRAERRWASDWDTKPFKRNAYMVSHGKIKILNQIIKDLKTMTIDRDEVYNTLTQIYNDETHDEIIERLDLIEFIKRTKKGA